MLDRDGPVRHAVGRAHPVERRFDALPRCLELRLIWRDLAAVGANPGRQLNQPNEQRADVRALQRRRFPMLAQLGRAAAAAAATFQRLHE